MAKSVIGVLVAPQRPKALIPGLHTVVSTQTLTFQPPATRVRRILLLEDDDTLREIIAEALTEDGYRVTAADNGFMALSLARESIPELAIVDLMLPQMNGEEFCTILRSIEQFADIPIILVSAAPYAEAAGARIPAVTTIRKPFDLNQLTEWVYALLPR